jgi:UDP-N-acetylglucosamine--N-acetylmuramyl-(pentapeptide) pyrophosphoryl-undecaprenol N-acetylglucosamine transferase
VYGRVLILAGGGGHTGYAYALAQALHGKVSLSFLVPEGDTLSERRVREFGEVDSLIKPRSPKTPVPIFMGRLAKAFLNSVGRTFHEFDVVVSSGSNFCVLPAIMAWMRGVPVVNIESPIRFTKPSISAFVLQPFSAITALWWKEQTRLLKGAVVGPLLPKPVVKPWNGGYVLVAGGQAFEHRALFDAIAESSLQNVVLQTGRVNPMPYAMKHPEWRVIALTEKFHELLAGAELVVSHFGFTAVEAAIVYRKPVVLVVNPEYLARTTAEMEDAEYLARKINAVLASEIKTEVLLDAMNEAKERKVPTFANGPENLANMIIELLQ